MCTLRFPVGSIQLFCPRFNSTVSAKVWTTELCDVLVVASITKALSENGGLNSLSRDADSITFTEDVVLQVIRRGSVDVPKKLAFFKWLSSIPSYRHSVTTYSQMLKAVTFFPHQYNHHIIELLSMMKCDGLTLDSGTLKLILSGLIKAQKFEFALQVLDYVEKELMNSCLSPDVYCPVVVALVRKNQISIALSVFYKLLDACSMPDAFSCNELLVGLKRGGLKDEFRDVFRRLRDMKLYPLDRWGYNICIHTFGSWGDLRTALCLFKEMKEKGGSVYPDLCTYNSLIQVLCLLGKVNDALVVWKELKDSSGYEPDSFTYRILIQGCSKSYRTNDAMKIFREMQYNRIETETVTYNSLLDGLFKSRKLTEACSFFETMVDNGVRPSCSTYNILLDGLYRNERPEAAYSLFSDLKRKGNDFIDGVTFGIVILNLCREDRLKEALQLVEEMEARGFAIDLVTVTSLLVALHNKGKWDWTERLMKHIRGGNLVPNVFKWKSKMESSLMSPQSKDRDFTSMFPLASDVTEVLELTKAIDTKNNDSNISEDVDIRDDDYEEWSSSPHMDQLAREISSSQTYSSSHLFESSRGVRVMSNGEESFDTDMVNTFLSIFLAKGKLSLACKLFEIFSNMGVNPVSYTYNSLISSFIKKGYFKEVWGVLQAMGETTYPADIATYNLIIQGLGKIGRADLASSVLDKLQKDGGFIDIVMYNTLINSLGKTGRLEDTGKLFQQMRTSGINPDVVTYNTLIEVHSKAGKLKEANKFLKMMLDAGCAPNHVTDTTLEYLKREIEKQRYQKASIIPISTNGNHP